MTVPTTIGAALACGRRRLRSRTDSPALDAAVLLGHLTGLSRATLLGHPETPLDPTSYRCFEALVERRARGEPVAYLTGRREFYGLSLRVDARVLVPRPETELLVEHAIARLLTGPAERPVVVDVGTGSGAIAVSIATHARRAVVVAADVSPDALAVARTNVRAHGLDRRVHLVAGSLLGWLGWEVDLIVANLPYLRPDQAHPSTAHEPPLALYGGVDGFDLYRQLLRQAPAALRPGGLLLAEIDPGQAALALATAAQAAPGWPTRIDQDLAGHDRVLWLQRP